MCIFSSPSAPAAPPPAPAPVDTTDIAANDTAVAAQDSAKKRAAVANGLQSTIASSPLGDTSQANVSRPSLLGLNSN